MVHVAWESLSNLLQSLSVATFSTFLQWRLDGIVPVPDDRTWLPKVFRHGSLGEMIEATWNGSPCAIKLFTRKQVLSSTIQRHERQFDYATKHLAQCLCHPNVVQFLGLWEDTDEDDASTEGLAMERLHTDLCTSFRTLHPAGHFTWIQKSHSFVSVSMYLYCLT